MTPDRKSTRIIRSWLEDGVTVLPDRVLDAVEESLHATPQRRAGWLSRLLPNRGNNRLRFGFAAVVIVAAIVGGVSVLPKDVGGPPAPTATPMATPDPLTPSVPRPGVVHTLEDFPVSVTFVVPDGWEECSAGPEEQGVCPSGSAGVSHGISFLIVDNVVAEPCKRALMDPPVGPTVDDLVAAILALEGFESTTPTDVTVDGYSGKELEVTAPPRPTCQLLTWATRSRTNGVAPREHNLLRIVDVAGTRVVIAAAFPDSVTAAVRSEIVQIVESVRFDD